MRRRRSAWKSHTCGAALNVVTKARKGVTTAWTRSRTHDHDHTRVSSSTAALRTATHHAAKPEARCWCWCWLPHCMQPGVMGRVGWRTQGVCKAEMRKKNIFFTAQKCELEGSTELVVKPQAAHRRCNMRTRTHKKTQTSTHTREHSPSSNHPDPNTHRNQHTAQRNHWWWRGRTASRE